MENSTDHHHHDHQESEVLQRLGQVEEALKTPLIVNNNKDSSYTELVFQFPTPSVFPNAQDSKSSGSERRTSESFDSNRKHSSYKNQKTAKTFLTLPGANSATKFANVINSLPSPICPVSTPLPLTSIGNLINFNC